MVAKFAYDGWNPAKPTPIGTENFDVWADLDGTGSLTTRYLHDDAVDALFARIDPSGGTGTGYYYLTDRLGSIREVAAAASGTVLDAITYDGFGKIASETNSTYRGRYAWTGRELDAEIDLQYNRARYYDASTGRWISQDPLGFDAGDGNLYRYVRNDSAGMTDASGLKDDRVSFDDRLIDLVAPLPVAPQSLSIVEAAKPIGFWRGGFLWPVYFQLDKKSDAKKGGVIIQHITVRFDVKDKNGNPIKDSRDNGKWNYWELFPVMKNSNKVLGHSAKTLFDKIKTTLSIADKSQLDDMRNVLNKKKGCGRKYSLPERYLCLARRRQTVR